MPVKSKIINPFLHNNYTQLAKVYKMKKERFSEVIEPIRDRIKVEDPFRNALTWKEIWIIVEYLGAPDPIEGVDPLYFNSMTRLADLYRVERRTFSKWINPIKHAIKLENPDRIMLTPKEVMIIIDHLGHPN
jgi:hypothetical protein